jgi:hypothetical protein
MLDLRKERNKSGDNLGRGKVRVAEGVDRRRWIRLVEGALRRFFQQNILHDGKKLQRSIDAFKLPLGKTFIVCHQQDILKRCIVLQAHASSP